MKYSILVPIWDPKNKLTEIINLCLDSIKKYSKDKDYELLVDSEPGGYGRAMNRMIKQAKGEYLICLASDIIINENNWLEKFTNNETITTFQLVPFIHNGELYPDTVYGIPKSIQEKIGLFDEQFSDGYGYDDNDYFHRARLLNIQFTVVPLQLSHLGSQTFDMYYGKEGKKDMTYKNKLLYIKKWKLNEDGSYS